MARHLPCRNCQMDTAPEVRCIHCGEEENTSPGILFSTILVAALIGIAVLVFLIMEFLL